MDRGVWIVLIIALVIAFISTNLVNRYSINDDARIIYFVQLAADSNLFKNDLMAKYSESAQAPATTTLLYVYYSFVKLLGIDHILLGKIFGIFLFLIAAVYTWKLGTAINNRSALLFALIIICGLATQWHVFSGGLSRAFGYPLFLAFLFFLIKEKNAAIATVLILMALFYPPILLLSLIIYGINALWKRKIKLFIGHAIIPSIILVLSFATKRNFGQMISLREAITMPEFYTGGRVPVFRGNIPFTDSIGDTIHSIINYHTTGVGNPLLLNFIFVLGLITTVLIVVYKKKLDIPKEMWSIPSAALICFVLSFIFFFYLYFPARYIAPAALVFSSCVVSLGIDRIAHRVTSRYKKIVITTSVLLIVLLATPKIRSSETLCEEKELYTFLESLQKDVLIAAHPTIADCIPTYSKRKVLIMGELSAGYHKDFYAEIKHRTTSFFDAYYASDEKKLKNFCKMWNVSYLVVDKSHFTPQYINQKKLYYEPFNTYIKSITINKSDFILANYPEKVFERDNIFVLTCEKT